MSAVACYDDGSAHNAVGQCFAFNLFACSRCGMVAREHVWSRAGTAWLDVEGAVTEEPASPPPAAEGVGGFTK